MDAGEYNMDAETVVGLHLKSPPLTDGWVLILVACVSFSLASSSGWWAAGPAPATMTPPPHANDFRTRMILKEIPATARAGQMARDRSGEPFSSVSPTYTLACGKCWKEPTLMSNAFDSSSLVRIHGCICRRPLALILFHRNVRIRRRRHHDP